MKWALLAAASLLFFSCARNWRHEPFWAVGFARNEGLAVGSGGDGPHTFGSRDYDGWNAQLGGRLVGTEETVEFGPISSEIVRGMGSNGNVGVVMGGNERINSLTSDLATERASAKALRDQVQHLESDLADKSRECIAVKAELLTATAEGAKLRSDLAEANDWSEKVDKWIEQFGLIGSIIVLIISGFFGWLIVRAWKGGKPEPAKG